MPVFYSDVFLSEPKLNHTTTMAHPLSYTILVEPLFSFFLTVLDELCHNWLKLSHLVINIVIHKWCHNQEQEMWHLLFTFISNTILVHRGFLAINASFCLIHRNVYRLAVTGTLISGAHVRCFRWLLDHAQTALYSRMFYYLFLFPELLVISALCIIQHG